jgi:hydrogenase maturation protease
MVVGIGSPNGDDKAGWRVIDLLSPRVADVCQLRRAKVPHELIDWIDDIDVLHVVDACEADESHCRVLRYQVAADNHDISLLSTQNGQIATLPRLRSGNTHQMDFSSVVQLARQLKKLPDDVTVWTVPGREFGPGEAVHPDCEVQIRCCADMLAWELAEVYDD